jgi:lysophospholipase L1-like esterase
MIALLMKKSFNYFLLITSCIATVPVTARKPVLPFVPPLQELHRPFGKADREMFVKPPPLYYPEGISGIQLSHGLEDTLQPVDSRAYLSEIKAELRKTWPGNRTINLLFHGHSVPAGYLNTPNVTLHAYPHLTLEAVKAVYPYAVVNAIVTAIGGENAEQGLRRFQSEVLNHRPDLLFIDYALNDRTIGLERAERAWEAMILQALELNIKVILLTPSPDLRENILDNNAPLAKHAAQIRTLAQKHRIGLVDSYAAFKKRAENGENLRDYMSQSNHPNRRGHELLRDLIVPWLMDDDELRRHALAGVREIMNHVADRQMIDSENQARKGSAWAKIN